MAFSGEKYLPGVVYNDGVANKIRYCDAAVGENMELYPNAINRLQALTLMRLKICALNERVMLLRSRAERVTGIYGEHAFGAGTGMEEKIIALVDAQRSLEALKRAWKIEAAKVAALLDAMNDARSGQALRLIYIEGKRAPAARRAMGLSEQDFMAAFKRGLNQVERHLRGGSRSNESS